MQFDESRFAETMVEEFNKKRQACVDYHSIWGNSERQIAHFTILIIKWQQHKKLLDKMNAS